MKAYEKLGAFYLGGIVGADGKPDTVSFATYERIKE